MYVCVCVCVCVCVQRTLIACAQIGTAKIASVQRLEQIYKEEVGDQHDWWLAIEFLYSGTDWLKACITLAILDQGSWQYTTLAANKYFGKAEAAYGD